MIFTEVSGGIGNLVRYGEFGGQRSCGEKGERAKS